MDLERARKILTDHSRSKKNGVLPLQVTHRYRMLNAKCGDQAEIALQLQDRTITEIGYSTRGCAICSASSSLLCQELKGLSIEEAETRLKNFVQAVHQTEGPWPADLTKLSCFEHLRVNPARRNCALLPWLAFERCLEVAATKR